LGQGVLRIRITIDEDPDPDQTFFFNADPGSDPDPSFILHGGLGRNKIVIFFNKN
jgi:hypothetical protein